MFYIISMDFLNKVTNFIEKTKMLSQGDRVVVGVSGGADSVALLSVLTFLRETYDLKLTVVCVNHGLRPEAVKEADYVAKLCQDLSVDFILREFDCDKSAKEQGIGTEEAGRKFRYEAFNEALGSDFGKIAIAHNMNDCAETVLFHLCRGTGPTGLAGIKPVSGNKIRPLLCVSREEIEKYLHDCNLKFFVDSSNLGMDYARNRIRNLVLPTLNDRINALSTEHIYNTAGLMGEMNDFVNHEVLAAYEKVTEMKPCKVSIDIKGLVNYYPYIRKMIIRMAIDNLVPANRDITIGHIESVLKLCEKDGYRSVDLPYKLTAYHSYDVLVLERFRGEAKEKLPGKVATKSAFTGDNPPDEECAAEYVICPGEGSYEIPGLGRVTLTVSDKDDNFVISQKEYTKCFDYAKIDAPIVLRKRREGDFLTIDNGKHKKLKDFLIDRKVSKPERDKIFVLACRSNILWVVGYRIGSDFKVSEQTNKILTVDIRPKEDIL